MSSPARQYSKLTAAGRAAVVLLVRLGLDPKVAVSNVYHSSAPLSIQQQGRERRIAAD